jgi:hypothetical protein
MQRLETAMRPATIAQLWKQVCRIDPTLKVTPRQLSALRRRQLKPVAFVRDVLFAAMARGEPMLFDDLPVPVQGEKERGAYAALLDAMRTGFPRRSRIRVRCGPSATQKHISVNELLRRSSSGRAKVSVTDLHIRGTNIIRRLDCSRLSDFNLLAEARGAVGDEEMLTVVLSSAGTFTDSHSDDPDGTNHCFAGRKLWLVWDTFAGLARELEDVERCDTSGPRAAFSMSGFLSVPGSRWFIIEAGQTLFLPGHLTHKVITLDDYLGVGSFFVMLPSYLRTLSRWTRHTPLWALDAPRDRRLDLVDKITQRIIHKIRLLARASEQERSRWGLAHLNSAVDEWLRTSSSRSKSLLLDHPISARFIKAVVENRNPGRGDRLRNAVHMQASG